MKIKTSEGTLSYQKVNFGIRKVETYVSGEERIYKINGKIIYMKGGNWVQDMMLNWNSKRFEQEIRLTKNANLNFLRIGDHRDCPKHYMMLQINTEYFYGRIS